MPRARKRTPCKTYRPSDDGDLQLIEEDFRPKRKIRPHWIVLRQPPGQPGRKRLRPRCSVCRRRLAFGVNVWKIAPATFLCAACKEGEDDAA